MTLGRYQRELFDSWNAAEVVIHIAKFEKELATLLCSSTWEAQQRRAQLDARVQYLRERLGGRTYELFASIGEVHATDCPVAVSVTCAAAIECKHGYSVCPECDVCNCAVGKVTKG